MAARGNETAGQTVPEDGHGALLVGRIGIGIDEGDGQRLHALVFQRLGQGQELHLVQGLQFPPDPVDPPGHLET